MTKTMIKLTKTKKKRNGFFKVKKKNIIIIKKVFKMKRKGKKSKKIKCALRFFGKVSNNMLILGRGRGFSFKSQKLQSWVKVQQKMSLEQT